MKRTYAHQLYDVNRGKEEQLLALFAPFHRALGAVQAVVRRQVLEGHPIPRYPALPDKKTVGGLSARQMKSAGNMVRSSYLSWQALLEDKVRETITSSTLDKPTKTMLYRLNKHHQWFAPEATLLWRVDGKTGELKPAARRGENTVELPVPGSVLKLLRRIVKHCMKTCSMPDLRHVNTLVLDSIVAKPERPETGNGSIGWWVKFATLTRGKPVTIPLTRNPYFEDTYTRFKQSGGGMCGVVQLTRRGRHIGKISLVLDKPDAAPHGNGKTLGIDYGMADALLATSDGGLLGHAMLDRIRRYDAELTGRAAWCQRRHIKPSKDRQYRRLQHRIRAFVANEIGRQLNRIASRDGQAKVRELVVEKLDFRYRGMSPAMNRLITRTGRAVFRQRLENLTERDGITITEVPSQYTSRECSGCGYTSKKNRKTRSRFVCRFCGKTMHADINAARVIQSRRSWHQPDNTGPMSRTNTLRLLDRRWRQRWHLPEEEAVPDVAGAPGDPKPAPSGTHEAGTSITCHQMT